MVAAATLPSGGVFAQWFSGNERLLQQDSANLELVGTVAVALLPCARRNRTPGGRQRGYSMTT